MSVLVIVEHDGKLLKPGVTNTITAASKLGGDVTVLVVGKEAAEAAQAAALIGDKRKGYTAIARQLAHYASNKATAMGCRLRGDIGAALIYENICDGIYNRLPKDLRW